VRRIFLALVLAAGCGGSSAGDKFREQLHHLTDKATSFDSPADPLALSPTPDNGPFATDPRKDCSSCPPR
jgi:hypothetical protein